MNSWNFIVFYYYTLQVINNKTPSVIEFLKSFTNMIRNKYLVTHAFSLKGNNMYSRQPIFK